MNSSFEPSEPDFFRTLADQVFDVNGQELEIIIQHIHSFPFHEPNEMMLQRLTDALQNNLKISGADASFYFHELKEFELIQTGLPWDDAHPAAIDFYNVSPFSLYHPKVIIKYPLHFNTNWKQAWGIK